MRTADSSPTAELWSTTHAALLAGRWSVARRLLEDLARRSDFSDTLPPLASYVRALESNGRSPCLDAGFAQLLVDRIELVNARAERNSATAFDSAVHAMASLIQEHSVR